MTCFPPIEKHADVTGANLSRYTGVAVRIVKSFPIYANAIDTNEVAELKHTIIHKHTKAIKPKVVQRLVNKGAR